MWEVRLPMTLFDRPYPFVHALGALRRHLLLQPVAGGMQASDGDRHLVGDLPVAQVHLDQHAKRLLRRRDPRHPLPKRRQETRIRCPERSVERSVPFSLRIGGKARGQQVLLPYRALGGVTLQVFRQYVESLVDPPAQMLPREHPAAPAEEERQHPAHHQNP